MEWRGFFVSPIERGVGGSTIVIVINSLPGTGFETKAYEKFMCESV